MILAFNLADIVQVPFGYLLSLLYQFTSNYGLALIFFAIIVKLVLLPASAKSKKSSTFSVSSANANAKWLSERPNSELA